MQAGPGKVVKACHGLALIAALSGLVSSGLAEPSLESATVASAWGSLMIPTPPAKGAAPESSPPLEAATDLGPAIQPAAPFAPVQPSVAVSPAPDVQLVKQEELPAPEPLPPVGVEPSPLSPIPDLGIPDLELDGECVGCGDRPCVPGQGPCFACQADTRLGRFACGIYQAICCPDPCYDPQWKAIADASFFTESARPVTQQRFRWDAGLNVVFPDRAEYFWARDDGAGDGPPPIPPWLGERSVTYHDLSLYTETAVERFSFFVEVPYRSVFPLDDPHAAGFGDMNLGTKSLVFDCELLQITLMFRTYIPVGNPLRGVGNGHMSLEPSIVFGLKLSPISYLQAQVAEWIPLGGDPEYQGSLLNFKFSYNRVLFTPLPNVPVIGTLEMMGWSFQAGAYTDPVLGTQQANGDTYISMGPGLRTVICDKVDFGVGVAVSLTEDHFAEQLIRSEFRYRY